MFSAVVTSHKNKFGLRRTIDSLKKQTYSPDEIIVMGSGYDEYLQFYFSGLVDDFNISENKNDWGHQKRSEGLFWVTNEWVGFFNDDDKYKRDYIETMLANTKDVDLVFCDFTSHLKGGKVITGRPRTGRISSGSFIVRTEFAKKVGYNHRDYCADGKFIEDLVRAGAKYRHVPEVLYHHL